MKNKLLTLALAGVLTGMSLLAPANSIPYTPLNEISRQAKKVAHEIHYEKDIGRDQWSPPEVTREVGFGDCEDYSILLKDNLTKKGIQTKFQPGKRTPKSKNGHAWLEYKDSFGKEYVIESTSGRIYDKEKANKKGYYQSYKNWKEGRQHLITELNSAAGRKIL